MTGSPIYFDQLERHGRLGNQLFQIAGTVGLARTYGVSPQFPASWSYREWFSCPDDWFVDTNVDAGRSAIDLAPLPKFAATYLQDLRLFNHVADEISAAFQPSAVALEVLDEIADGLFVDAKEIVSVHVRRGDNVTNDPGTINCLPLSYYMEAIEFFAWRPGSFTIVLFSDDPEWCDTNMVPLLELLGHDVRVFRGVPRPKENGPDYVAAPASDWIDLQLMARASSHVLSNSSYAWWGAWLSNDPWSVMPSYWFGEVLVDRGCDPGLIVVPGWKVWPVKDPAPIST